MLIKKYVPLLLILASASTSNALWFTTQPTSSIPSKKEIEKKVNKWQKSAATFLTRQYKDTKKTIVEYNKQQALEDFFAGLAKGIVNGIASNLVDGEYASKNMHAKIAAKLAFTQVIAHNFHDKKDIPTAIGHIIGQAATERLLINSEKPNRKISINVSTFFTAAYYIVHGCYNHITKK